MKKLLILCGGQSPEHSISIRSCKNILKAIDRSKYEITIIGISMKGSWHLMQEEEIGDEVDDLGRKIVLCPGQKDSIYCDGQSLGDFEVAFPVLHGPNGEDGTVQGLLKLLGIPFVGPGVLGSSMCMDKDITKRILKQCQIRVADWILIRKGESIPDHRDIVKKLGNVVFVKPANMGSSVGVHRVSSEKEWKDAVKDAMQYDKKIVIERMVKGRELECAVLGNDDPKASCVGEVKSGDFYSYDEKYASTSHAQTIIPAEVNPDQLKLLQKTAIEAYKALNCEGMSRVDMFLIEEEHVYVNEINTIPGFTSISMYPKLWEESGIGYPELIDQLIELALEKSS